MGDTVFNCLSHFCGCTVSGDMDRSGALTLRGGGEEGSKNDCGVFHLRKRKGKSITIQATHRLRFRFI